jgi:hypothetical protein
LAGFQEASGSLPMATRMPERSAVISGGCLWRLQRMIGA